jgi:hypothetical protein
VTLLSCQTIDERHLVSNVSHFCWIRIACHITQVLTFVCIMVIPSKSTIPDMSPNLLTSMATICSASTTIIVIKNEDLELFSVERQLISYQ